jgi:soluble lytic murein transglycosylase-like protein
VSALPALARLVALLGVLLVPPAARAADTIYSYRDADGVVHFTNAPSDRRFKKIGRLASTTALYGKGKAEVLARPLPRGGSRDRYREHIRTAAERYKLPEALLLAVMAVESNFDHRAVSEKGAMGLMQLMPGTAKEMYVSDAWDPSQNIEGGARYLRILANQYQGDLVKTLAAYNAGPEAVRRAGGEVPNIPETREYVRKVVALYEAYKAGK